VYCAAGAAGAAACAGAAVGMSNAADFAGIVDASFFFIMLQPTVMAQVSAITGTSV
jgi:hypothetical protein